MAGLLKLLRQQLGDSATATQNFTVTAEAADGTMKIARGNAGATTQDVLTVDASGNVQLTKTTSQSMVRLNTANGYGSTSTKIRRFTNVVTNQGSDITYTDSATLGASFTINISGVYAISYSFAGTGSMDGGVSINTTVPTTSILTIPLTENLVMATSPSANFASVVSSIMYLPSGSVLRPHTDGAVASGSRFDQFTIARVS